MADDTIVEVLDLSGQAFSGFKDQGFQAVGDRRTLVSDIRRGLTAFECGLGMPRLEKLADDVKPDFLADVVLD